MNIPLVGRRHTTVANAAVVAIRLAAVATTLCLGAIGVSRAETSTASQTPRNAQTEASRDPRRDAAPYPSVSVARAGTEQANEVPGTVAKPGGGKSVETPSPEISSSEPGILPSAQPTPANRPVRTAVVLALLPWSKPPEPVAPSGPAGPRPTAGADAAPQQAEAPNQPPWGGSNVEPPKRINPEIPSQPLSAPGSRPEVAVAVPEPPLAAAALAEIPANGPASAQAPTLISAIGLQVPAAETPPAIAPWAGPPLSPAALRYHLGALGPDDSNVRLR